MSKIPRLFELMQERGITAKKLSNDTKISTGNISDWKSGRSRPSSEKISILAKYFNVSTDYLLGNELEGIEFALMSESEGLTEDQKQDVLKYIRFLKADNNKE